MGNPLEELSWSVSGLGQGGGEFCDDVFYRCAQIEPAAGLVSLKALESLELGCHQGRRHEVVQALSHALGDDLLVAVKVQELHSRRSRAQHVAIQAAKGRATGDTTGLLMRGEPLADCLKPGRTIFVV